MEKIRTTVRIAGREYTIASTDSEEYVARVAAWVDRRMNELSAATRLPVTSDPPRDRVWMRPLMSAP